MNKPSDSARGGRWLSGGPAWMLTSILLAGCATSLHHSDFNSVRPWQPDQQRRLGFMRMATEQAPRATPLRGQALEAVLAGHTHVFIHGQSPTGRRERYVVEYQFLPDNRFVQRDSYQTGGSGLMEHWRVEDDLLCLERRELGESCYSLERGEDGVIRYFIAAPGKESHGLLSLVVDEIR